MAKWKLQPPANGEGESKEVNGRTFMWCQKCSNWTTTHNTATRTGSSEDKGIKSRGGKKKLNK